MTRFMLLAGLAAFATPALAQPADTPAADPQMGQTPAAPPETTPPEMAPPETTPPPAGSDPVAPSESPRRSEAANPDSDGNGSLDRSEFTAWYNAHGGDAPGESAASAFDAADSNRDGSISPSELSALHSRPH